MSLELLKQPLFILSACFIGLGLGKFTTLEPLPTIFVELFLMILLFILFLTLDLEKTKGTTRKIKFTCLAVCINFVITPISAYLLGQLFFGNSLEIRIGLLMLLVTPCTDWYLIFTGLSKGNVALNLSLLPINLILQIILMPVYLYLFVGEEMQMQLGNILQSMLLVLFIPFLFALFAKKLLKNKFILKDWIATNSDNLQLLFLCMAVFVMFFSESENIFLNASLLLELFLPLLIFFLMTFFIAQVLGKLMKFEKSDIISLNFTTLARNSPLSLSIAVATFPDLPLVSLSLVIAPLIELPVLAVVSSFLLKWNK